MAYAMMTSTDRVEYIESSIAQDAARPIRSPSLPALYLSQVARSVFSPNTLTFTVFFPVITLAAFLWGLKPSIFAIGSSTVVACSSCPPWITY